MAVERTSGGFGGKLRDARERRGISLRQIANATKISIGALEALERNDISKLPGGIFSRAFVRSYAIEVGLDPDATIQEFIAQFPNDPVTQTNQPFQTQFLTSVCHHMGAMVPRVGDPSCGPAGPLPQFT